MTAPSLLPKNVLLFFILSFLFFQPFLLAEDAGGLQRAANVVDANELALRIMDCEALYTVSGGLKPVSEGFWRERFPKGESTSQELVRVKKMLKGLPIGNELSTGVLLFNLPDGQVSASAFIAHLPSVRKQLERRWDVFQQLAITSDSSVQEIMEAAEQAKGSLRWNAFGLLFGYPDHAVEFFVRAGEIESTTGVFQVRDFFQIPTYTSAEGRFVYAVPKDYEAVEEDRILRASAMKTLEKYRPLRERNEQSITFSGTVLLHQWVQQCKWRENTGVIYSLCNPQYAPIVSPCNYCPCSY